jgi:hypothetical protein
MTQQVGEVHESAPHEMSGKGSHQQGDDACHRLPLSIVGNHDDVSPFSLEKRSMKISSLVWESDCRSVRPPAGRGSAVLGIAPASPLESCSPVLHAHQARLLEKADRLRPSGKGNTFEEERQADIFCCGQIGRRLKTGR